jgi:hypothetical protein
MRGHVCKVQVLMRRRTLVAASFADCSSACTRHELCDSLPAENPQRMAVVPPPDHAWQRHQACRDAPSCSLSCSQAAAVAVTTQNPAPGAMVTPRAFVTAAYNGDIALVYACLVADAATVHVNGGGTM